MSEDVRKMVQPGDDLIKKGARPPELPKPERKEQPPTPPKQNPKAGENVKMIEETQKK